VGELAFDVDDFEILIQVDQIKIEVRVRHPEAVAIVLVVHEQEALIVWPIRITNPRKPFHLGL